MEKIGYKTLEELEAKWRKNPELVRAYDALEPEFALMRSLIEKRIKAGLTQGDLAEKIGTRQSVISRLEGGEGNPTLGTLRKVAEALGAQLSVVLK